MAAKLVFSYSSEALGCLPAASTSHSTFRIIISEAAELPSPAGTEKCPQKSGHWWHWGDEGVGNWWIFYEKAVPVETGAALTAQQQSHSVNVPRVFMPSVAFPVGLSLACLFSLSQERDAEGAFYHLKHLDSLLPEPICWLAQLEVYSI